jgi:type I site-specific restriction-modification system R (restriction) subunit
LPNKRIELTSRCGHDGIDRPAHFMAGEEKTKDVFGDYISIYNFKQSIDDGATVPLFYENRILELQLTNENLNEDMENLLEEADLTEEQQQKLEREFPRTSRKKNWLSSIF